MDSLILGFGYKARQGKDTCAEAILKARGGQFDIKRMSFALALKTEVNELYKLYWPQTHTVDETWRAVFEHCWKLGMPTRIIPADKPDLSDPLSPFGKQVGLLQWYGTEYRRAQNQDYWVERFDDAVESNPADFVLVTDVRFKNEADYILNNRGLVVKVSRTGYVDPTRSSTHASECELDDYEFPVSIEAGNGEVEHLGKMAVAIFDVAAHTNPYK